MSKCPVCGHSSTQLLCPECGYNLEIDDKMHRLSSRLNRAEIENYQKQIQRLKVIYNKKMKQISSMVSMDEIEKYKNQLSQEREKNQVLVDQINHLVEEGTTQNQINDRKIQELEFENTALITELDSQKSQLYKATQQTHINQYDSNYMIRCVRNCEFAYVLSVPIVIVFLFIIVGILMNYFGRYIPLLDNSFIKIIVHTVLSSYVISLLSNNMININYWIYKQEHQNLSTYQTDICNTVIVTLILAVLESILMYYYCPVDSSLYSMQYLLILILNSSMLMSVSFLDYGFLYRHRYDRFIFLIVSLIVTFLFYILYFHKVSNGSYSHIVIITYFILYVLNVFAMLYPGIYSVKNILDMDSLYLVPFAFIVFCVFYILSYFLFQWVINIL